MNDAKAVRDMKTEHDWRAEDDLRVMVQHEEICKDPKRKAAAKALAKKKLAAMTAVVEKTERK